ncbi:MAG: MAPEG family protein [Roseateles sp.]|uniref:MAPEG family protein n=1 Tax=Roseateles sp. TaxID=1971397 RepID=UPI004035B884
MTQSTEAHLFWLTLTTVLTGLAWVPYVINRFRELGMPGWAWFPAADPPHRADWANRSARAHANAVENLIVFAPLALAVALSGQGDAFTIGVCQTYFWARVGHIGASTAGLPIVPRTVCFLIGVACQLLLAMRLLGWL